MESVHNEVIFPFNLVQVLLHVEVQQVLFQLLAVPVQEDKRGLWLYRVVLVLLAKVVE